MTKNTPTIFVLLPVYNEESSILDLVKELNGIATATPDHQFHVIAVDDGSLQQTKDYLKSCAKLATDMTFTCLTHEVNKGLNEALNTGFAFVQKHITPTDFLVTMDGDNTHNPNMIRRMLQRHKEGADVVIASRYRDGAVIHGLSSFRKFLSIGARFLYQTMWRFEGVRDYTCLFRSHTGEIMKQYYDLGDDAILKSKGFACTTECLKKFNSIGAVFTELPMILVYSKKVAASNAKIMKTIYTSLKIIFFGKS